MQASHTTAAGLQPPTRSTSSPAISSISSTTASPSCRWSIGCVLSASPPSDIALHVSNRSVRLDEIRKDLLDGYKWVLNELPRIHPEVDAKRNFVFGGSAGGTSTMLVVRLLLIRPYSWDGGGPQLTAVDRREGRRPALA